MEIGRYLRRQKLTHKDQINLVIVTVTIVLATGVFVYGVWIGAPLRKFQELSNIFLKRVSNQNRFTSKVMLSFK